MEATQSQIEMTTKWELVEEFKNKNGSQEFLATGIYLRPHQDWPIQIIRSTR